MVSSRREILRNTRAQRGIRAALGYREELVNLMGGEAHEFDLEESVGMINTW